MQLTSVSGNIMVLLSVVSQKLIGVNIYGNQSYRAGKDIGNLTSQIKSRKTLV